MQIKRYAHAKRTARFLCGATSVIICMLFSFHSWIVSMVVPGIERRRGRENLATSAKLYRERERERERER
jgi:hypothetical protein